MIYNWQEGMYRCYLGVAVFGDEGEEMFFNSYSS